MNEFYFSVLVYLKVAPKIADNAKPSIVNTKIAIIDEKNETFSFFENLI